MRGFPMSAVVAGALLVGAAGAPAVADDHAGHSGAATVSSSAPTRLTSVSASAPAMSLIAQLDGAQEVPAPNGPAVGDQDGKAVALIKVKGDRITFALTWNGIDTPTLGHIHEGKAGTNGAVKVGLFTTAMPAGVHSAAGQTAITDAALAERLRTDPSGFYVNLHSAEFPGGAVRGQLKPFGKAINPLSIIRGGKLRALADGGQEIPADDPAAAGDPDGHAVAFVHPGQGMVGYSVAWVNIAAPVAGHIHQGALGRNGDVKVPLFTTPAPENIFALSGAVPVAAAATVQQLKQNPTAFYANVHTAEFPDGAVRGQLFR